MPLETGEFITDLVITNPLGTDPKSQGDDHLRLLKKTVQQSFPNIDAEVSATPAELNTLVGVKGPGLVVQAVNFQTGEVVTGVGTFPMDNTIPQITEGSIFLQQAFTPKFADSVLRFDITFSCSLDLSQFCVGALFKDGVADALGAIAEIPGTVNSEVILNTTIFAPAVAIDPTTYYWRAGSDSGGVNLTMNGRSLNRDLGGVGYSSMTITELAAV